MLVDANILIYAVDQESPHHNVAESWLTDRLNGDTRVGLPWSSLSAFLRISTHPRISDTPLTPDVAWSFVEDWLACDVAWIPAPTPHHADILGGLIRMYQLGGNLIPDADLATLAIEHGLELCSADTDFARFQEIRWFDPISPEV